MEKKKQPTIAAGNAGAINLHQHHHNSLPISSVAPQTLQTHHTQLLQHVHSSGGGVGSGRHRNSHHHHHHHHHSSQVGVGGGGSRSHQHNAALNSIINAKTAVASAAAAAANSAAALHLTATAAATGAGVGGGGGGAKSTALVTTSPSAAASVRSKNEEAIHDLRQRIPEIENIFDVHSRIGNGTFSTVLLGTLKKERTVPENLRRKFAIKHHIPTSHPDRIMKELQCMAKIGGTDNVVGINCCIRYNESVAFIMPYMPHDRFHDFFNKMDLIEVQYYLKNLLIALRHVHKFNVIHRDVKPSNFLYNRRKRQFLLVDFGLAQQVPTPQMSLSGSASGGALPLTADAGKRLRDSDDGKIIAATDAGISSANNTTPSSSGANAAAAASAGSDTISGTAKRLRCTGPQGDQQVAASVSAARVTASCAVMSGNSPAATFKMPLKQLNEISTPSKAAGGGGGGTGGAASGGNSAVGASSAHSGICESPQPTPLSRQVKSAILGASIGNRLQAKLRGGTQPVAPSQISAATRSATLAAATGTATGAQVPAACNSSNAAAVTPANNAADDASTAAANKYNTNRNLTANTNAAATAAPSSPNTGGGKCYCYGNPQVCSICLIKKEIHASRAGTPGYRPPEVLLKYPDQTTAVDVWAAGVIFLSILSSVYPFFKAPNDYVALAEMVTIFGDKTIRKTAFLLDRLVTLSQKTKPLDLRKLCVRFRNRQKFSSPELLKKYQRSDGSCEVCKNCDQFYFNCLCTETNYNTEPLESDDCFPASAYDLLYKLLEVNPHKRITAEEALKHPFFSETTATAHSAAAASNASSCSGASTPTTTSHFVAAKTIEDGGGVSAPTPILLHKKVRGGE